MKTLDYQFPKVRGVDMVFSTFDTPEVLLKEAKERGFYNGSTPENDLFSDWFFSGLEKAPEYKEGVDVEKAQKAMNWALAYMRSFAPKHEEKEAVCALIFNEALAINPH